MAKRIGRYTVAFESKPSIVSSAAIVGKNEGEGPLFDEFDEIVEDATFGMENWEQAESELQRRTVQKALEKANIAKDNVDIICAGDLLSQCIGSSFGLKSFNIPFVGMYGACSTMALTLATASVFIDSGAADIAVAETSSHFCSAEKQFRYPLEYGGQRTPTAQRTATASGAMVLKRNEKSCVHVEAATFGRIQDLGIKDPNNMGAAMAPDDVKIRPCPKLEGMVFFYTQIQYLRGGSEHFLTFSNRINHIEKTGSKFHALCESFS